MEIELKEAEMGGKTGVRTFVRARRNRDPLFLLLTDRENGFFPYTQQQGRRVKSGVCGTRPPSDINHPSPLSTTRVA